MGRTAAPVSRSSSFHAERGKHNQDVFMRFVFLVEFLIGKQSSSDMPVFGCGASKRFGSFVFSASFSGSAKRPCLFTSSVLEQVCVFEVSSRTTSRPATDIVRVALFFLSQPSNYFASKVDPLFDRTNLSQLEKIVGAQGDTGGPHLQDNPSHDPHHT